MRTRNPFKLKASEYIESETDFLQLFSPGVLDLLPVTDEWTRVQIFESAPGGGKTSLFRLLTPLALTTLHSFRNNDDYRDLYKKLEGLEVISEEGPLLMGIMLSCQRGYDVLEDLAFESHQKERLLYSLLNARLMLATLRGTLELAHLSYPKDLNRLEVRYPTHNGRPDWLPISFPVPANGKELFEWALAIEENVRRITDSFLPMSDEDLGELQGHDTLYTPLILKPDSILCDNQPISYRLLFLLDDVHKLTGNQRHKLFEKLLELRLPTGFWLAERLEALSPHEMLARGATIGREYSKPINLEEYWRTSTKRNQFQSAVSNIADRRAQWAWADVHIPRFESCLQDSLIGNDQNAQFEEAINQIRARIYSKISSNDLYTDWFSETEKLTTSLSPQDSAIKWRETEILIERDRQKPQLQLGLAFPPDELESRTSSSVRAAAEFFVTQEFNIPYYYGIWNLAYLSSSNIQQFLSFASEMFEELISLDLLGKQPSLTPDRQEKILKRVAHQRWDDIRRTVPNGRDIQRLLEAIRRLAQRETFRPNAPYAPGVTGIAITMLERDRLIKSKEYHRLAYILTTAIAENLLEVSLDRSQGQKGKKWMIMYLNRWLCLQFGLPLQYGGWRPKKLDDLSMWLEQDELFVE